MKGLRRGQPPTPPPPPWALQGHDADGGTLGEAPCAPVRGAGSGRAAGVEGPGLRTEAACTEVASSSSSKHRVMAEPVFYPRHERGLRPRCRSRKWPSVPGRGRLGGWGMPLKTGVAALQPVLVHCCGRPSRQGAKCRGQCPKLFSGCGDRASLWHLPYVGQSGNRKKVGAKVVSLSCYDRW